MKPYIPPQTELSKLTRSQLDKLCVVVFSRYIRLRGADHRGFNECFTCRRKMHWGDLQCGHFVKRAHVCTRFMEANNHPQCHHCNVILGGNEKVYAQRLDEVYGEGMAEYLRHLGRQTCKWSKVDYYDLMNHLDEQFYGKEKSY